MPIDTVEAHTDTDERKKLNAKFGSSFLRLGIEQSLCIRVRHTHRLEIPTVVRALDCHLKDRSDLQE